MQSFVFFALGALSGPIYDRGHLKLLLSVGTFCIVFGHMMLSLCNSYWQFVLAQGFVIGIGGGCLFVPALAVVQPYFSSTRLGMALGIIGTGSSIGCVVYAVIFINLIDHVGFAWTVRTLGFVALAILSIPVVVMQMRGKPPAARKILDLSALTDRTFMLSILGCFLGYGGCQVSFFYIAYYGQANGWLAGNLSLYLLPIVNAASIFGRVLPNVLADKIGPVNVIIPGTLAFHIMPPSLPPFSLFFFIVSLTSFYILCTRRTSHSSRAAMQPRRSERSGRHLRRCLLWAALGDIHLASTLALHGIH